jgi:hypothetical protein
MEDNFSSICANKQCFQRVSVESNVVFLALHTLRYCKVLYRGDCFGTWTPTLSTSYTPVCELLTYSFLIVSKGFEAREYFVGFRRSHLPYWFWLGKRNFGQQFNQNLLWHCRIYGPRNGRNVTWSIINFVQISGQPYGYYPLTFVRFILINYLAKPLIGGVSEY